MSNPHSQAEPDASSPADSVASGTHSGKTRRKGPRRATAPAGAPVKTAAAASALLVIGSDGMIVPAPSVEIGDNDTSTDAPGTEVSKVVTTDATGTSLSPISTGTENATHDAGHSPATETAPAAPAAPAEHDAVATPAVEIGDNDTSTDAPGTEVSTEDTAGTSLSPISTGAEGDKAAAEEAAPVSRRERRQTEQKVGSGVEFSKGAPAAAAALEARKTEPPKTKTLISETPEAAATGVKAGKRKRNRFVAFIRGLSVLLVISVLVMGLGTVLSGTEDAALRESQTELNRQAAWEKTTTLAAQATALSVATSPPKVQELLNQAAKDLAVQAAALSDGLPPNTASPTTAPAAPEAVTVTEFMLALSANGDELLTNALTADHAMGRVFAAVGTSQLLQGQNLSTAVGGTPPVSGFLPARVNFAAPEGPVCRSTLEPRPGATVDSALRAAALGEQKAVYAYQVATTRLTEPRFSTSAELLARHETKLGVLNAELRVRCLPLAAPVAGFALDAAFIATPGPALSGLEAELAGIYADLAALSTASAPAPPSDSAGETGAANPPAAPASPTQSNITELREISVTWLLDSARTQGLWGGVVDALPGMPDA